MTENFQARRTLFNQLKKLPKIDLHRHLEGSLRLQTLYEIATENKIDLPTADLRPHVQVMGEQEHDFLNFLAKFAILRQFYSSRDAISRIAYEAVADAALDNIYYLELRFNPVALALTQGFKFEDVTDWVIDAVNRASAEHKIQVRLIVTINRVEPHHMADLLEIAIAKQSEGIVGLDLAGDERNYADVSEMVPIFKRAKEEGLFITIHAAEAGPPLNAQVAVEQLGADRLGHGIRIREDANVLELIRQRRTPLEMCPTSNLQTGAIKKFREHPLYSYHKLNIPVTVNTDDPSVSNITLTDEYMVTLRGIDVPRNELRPLILNAAQAAFLPPNEKAQLVAWYERALTQHDF